MKVLLSFAVSLLLTANCFAASPSFSSFYTNHFLTNGLLIKAKLNPTQFDTNATAITITITNIGGIAGQIWTNSLGVVKIAPEITYDYVAPSNTLLKGWFSTSPQIALLSLGTNVIDTTTQASHLLFSQTNDAAQVTLSLTDGPTTDGPAGAFLEIMSYTNTVWDGRFTLPHGSLVSGGGFVRLNNGQDWIGANGNVLQLKWIQPDWWEIGRWSAGTNSQPGLVVINPTDTYLPYRIDEDEFGDSPLFRTGPSSLGLGTNLAAFWTPGIDDIFAGTHDVAAGESDYSYFYLANVDDGTSATNYADLTIELNTSGLDPAAQFNLAAVATNDVSRLNVLLQPVAGAAVITLIDRGTNTVILNDGGGFNYGKLGWMIGQDAPDWHGNMLNGETLVGVQNVGEGDPNNNELYLATVQDSDDFTEYHLTLTATSVTGALANSVSGVSSAVNSIVDGSGPRITITTAGGGVTPMKLHPGAADGAVPYIFDATIAQTLGPLMSVRSNTVDSLKFGPGTQIGFGVGTTNTLFRNINDLVYTNGGNSVNFEVRKGDASSVKLGLSTGSHGQVIAGTGSDFYIGVNNNGSGDFVFTGSSFSSTANGLDDLGGVVNQWNNFYLDNSILFGGITNFISRVGDTDVVYEGPAMVGNNVAIGVKRGASTVYFGQTPAGGAIVQSPSNRAILDVGGAQAIWDGTNFLPDPTGKNLGTAANPWTNLFLAGGGGNGVFIRAGSGDPNGAVTANVGSLFLRLDGGAGSVLYVKEVGTDNMGWAAK